MAQLHLEESAHLIEHCFRLGSLRTDSGVESCMQIIGERYLWGSEEGRTWQQRSWPHWGFQLRPHWSNGEFWIRDDPSELSQIEARGPSFAFLPQPGIWYKLPPTRWYNLKREAALCTQGCSHQGIRPRAKSSWYARLLVGENVDPWGNTIVFTKIT